MTNATNFKTKIETLIEIKLEEWATGQVKWNVGNQHDETVLEYALETLKNNCDADELFEKYGSKNISLMSLAHNLSEWDAPELSAAWTD